MNLSDYISALKDVDAPLAQIKGSLSRTVKGLILQSYDAQTSPYGTQWAPLIYRNIPPPILNKTGTGRKSLQVKTTGTGITATFTAPYMRFHQTGTATMAQRQILPNNVWPVRWIAAVENHWLEAFQRYWVK